MKLAPTETCCGCAACKSVCQLDAIQMLPDEEGFLRPAINEGLCVHCNKCATICHAINNRTKRKPKAVYAAKAHDDAIRFGSASGGIFTLVAHDIIKRGGVAFGAGFEPKTFRVTHKSAASIDALEDLRGSKYVQSDIGYTFPDVRQILRAEKPVVYSALLQ